jgi:hypothetical protein
MAIIKNEVRVGNFSQAKIVVEIVEGTWLRSL